MQPLEIRKGLDQAIDKLMCKACDANSEPVKLKLRRAYAYLRIELETIDNEILAAIQSEAA